MALNKIAIDHWLIQEYIVFSSCRTSLNRVVVYSIEVGVLPFSVLNWQHVHGNSFDLEHSSSAAVIADENGSSRAAEAAAATSAAKQTI